VSASKTETDHPGTCGKCQEYSPVRSKVYTVPGKLLCRPCINAELVEVDRVEAKKAKAKKWIAAVAIAGGLIWMGVSASNDNSPGNGYPDTCYDGTGPYAC